MIIIFILSFFYLSIKVWTIVEGKAKKVEVTLGNADALNQEVTAGIAAGDQVITIPTPDLEEGKEVEANEEPTY